MEVVEVEVKVVVKTTELWGGGGGEDGGENNRIVVVMGPPQKQITMSYISCAQISINYKFSLINELV